MSAVLYEENNLFIGIIIQGNKLTWKKRPPLLFPPRNVSLIYYQLALCIPDSVMVNENLSLFSTA